MYLRKKLKMNYSYTRLLALASAIGLSSAPAAVIYDSNIYSYSNGTSFNLVTPTGVTALTFTGGVNGTGSGISYLTMQKVDGVSTSAVKSEFYDPDYLVAPPSAGDTISTLTSGFSTLSTDRVYLMSEAFSGAFLNSTRYIGFYFDNDTVHNYGWALVQGSPASSAGSVIGWAYENTGNSITVGAIPEPSSFVLCGIGGFALAIGHRRRRTA